MELTPKWLDADSVKPKAGWIVCVKDCDGLISHGWTVKKDSEWRVIAWQAGAEGMPAKGEQVLVRLGRFSGHQYHGLGVTRLARVGYSDNEYYVGFLTFVLEDPHDRDLEWSDSVIEWAYLPGEE